MGVRLSSFSLVRNQIVHANSAQLHYQVSSYSNPARGDRLNDGVRSILKPVTEMTKVEQDFHKIDRIMPTLSDLAQPVAKWTK